MTDAPKTVGLVHNGFGGWRLWTADDADDPTVVAVPYILVSEHKRLLAERDRLRAVAEGRYRGRSPRHHNKASWQIKRNRLFR